jgi:hypothetical protein
VADTQDMTTTTNHLIPTTITFDITPELALVLQDNGWTWDTVEIVRNPAFGPLTNEPFVVARVTFEYDEAACGEVDLIDAAHHCAKLAGINPQKVEVVR